MTKNKRKQHNHVMTRILLLISCLFYGIHAFSQSYPFQQQSRSTVEMKDKNSRPAITDKLANMQDYEVIYVGFPIWWYTAPTIINTFMEAYDFKGKTVIPFATSGGSSIKKACEDLKAAYPNVTWKEGKLLNRVSKQELETWVKGL